MPNVKKFSITVPDSVFKDLEVLAEYQGRPTANLAAFLVELGLHIYKERDEFPKDNPEIKGQKK
jgi:CopG-like RHH_1 or ribbon-helix-helix domain, RHH_5